MGMYLVRVMRKCVPGSERLAAVLAVTVFVTACSAMAQTGAAPAKTPPILGTIKALDGSTITVTSDAGAETKVAVAAATRLLRVPPGSKDLSQAVAIPLTEFQPGDRVLVSVRCAGDAAVCEASRIVAMKKADIAEKQTQEREAWRRGIGGLVKSVDAEQKIITIGTVSAAGKKDVAVSVGSATAVRRYAPGSVKFDDAQPSRVAEIQPGDQLRARGVRGTDGATFTADEIVTGAFLNIAGTVGAVDAGAGTISITDPATKKAQVVKVSPDTQLRKLPANMAQMIAMRLKGGAASVPGGAPNGNAGPAPSNGGVSNGTNGNGGAARAGGDFQQMLSRLPATPLTDFQKGDAVMIVATGAQKDGQATAITVLGGVEPLLQAGAQEQASTILSPWSLSGGGGDAGGAQ
jgi:hypothetical protein